MHARVRRCRPAPPRRASSCLSDCSSASRSAILRSSAARARAGSHGRGGEGDGRVASAQRRPRRAPRRRAPGHATRRSLHTATILRRLASAAAAPSSAPSAIMPSATCHGRNDGVDAEERRELAVEAAAHEQEEHREQGDRAGGAHGALQAALDDERLLHEAVGRADELEHLDLGAAPLQRACASSSRRPRGPPRARRSRAAPRPRRRRARAARGARSTTGRSRRRRPPVARASCRPCRRGRRRACPGATSSSIDAGNASTGSAASAAARRARRCAELGARIAARDVVHARDAGHARERGAQRVDVVLGRAVLQVHRRAPRVRPALLDGVQVRHDEQRRRRGTRTRRRARRC